MSQIFEDYLVKLGFSVDQVSFNQFTNAMRGAADSVSNEYVAMAKSVITWQGAVTGAFAAVGLGVLDAGLKVADADQEYRLLALHMYTSLPVARELKIALDALGQPLENIQWDPELAKRFHTLVQDQRELTQQLGPNFENQMLKIRDLRFEYTRFGVELQYLTMEVVGDLASAFGVTMDDALDKMHEWNAWFRENMPAIAQWITDKLNPALHDTWDIMKMTGDAVKEGYIAFQNLIGLLSGDKKLLGDDTSFDKVALTIQHITEWMKDFIKITTDAEQSLSHLFIAMSLASHGDFTKAIAELGLAAQFAGDAEITVTGNGQTSDKTNFATPDIIKRQIVDTAIQLGIDPKLALAVAGKESGYRQFNKYGDVLKPDPLKYPNSHAMGIFQLQPGTARDMGVDPHSIEGNILGGEKYLKYLLEQSHGNIDEALGRYSGTSQDQAAMSAYTQDIEQREANITINGMSITVNAKTDANAKDIAFAIEEALHRSLAKATNQTQRNLTEFNQPGVSY